MGILTRLSPQKPLFVNAIGDRVPITSFVGLK